MSFGVKLLGGAGLGGCGRAVWSALAELSETKKRKRKIERKELGDLTCLIVGGDCRICIVFVCAHASIETAFFFFRFRGLLIL